MRRSRTPASVQCNTLRRSASASSLRWLLPEVQSKDLKSEVIRRSGVPGLGWNKVSSAWVISNKHVCPKGQSEEDIENARLCAVRFIEEEHQRQLAEVVVAGD
mmetsp:Transcript_42454/g.90415  ORF Transcript_42454/g.90415 Transcript_42454/m.90415 type:complete len:103 (+) Transcript_42454:2556-2864(+)